MKPVPLAIVIVTIALGSGAGGYLLGTRKYAGDPPLSQNGIVAHTAGNSPETVKRAGLQAVVPRDLRARLDGEKNPLLRFKLALQNLDAWVAKDPKDALSWLASQQPSDRRDDIIRRALNQYSETDAKGAADWALKNLSGADLNNSLIAIADNWAQASGREAAAWFLGLPVTIERDGAVENIFFSWASNEPAAALEYIAANPSIGDLASTLRRAALAGWAKSDPEGAVTASLALSKTNNDPGQFANTLANWATMNLEGSSQWLLANVQPGTERTAAAGELGTIFASQSPDAGVAWLEKLNAGAERDAAASSLAAGWSTSAPAAAATWAASQTAMTFSPEAISEIAHNFLMKDPAAFQAWRTALPDGPLKTQVSQVGKVAEDK